MNSIARFAGRLTLPVLLVVAAAAPQPADAAFLDVVIPKQQIIEGTTAQVAVALTRDVNDTGACTLTGTLATADGEAIAGQDYTAINTPFTITMNATDPSAASGPINIDIAEDALFEIRESFSLNVTADLASCSFFVQDNTPGFAVIDEDDPMPASLQFNQTVVSVDETGKTVTLRVDLVGTQLIQPQPFQAFAVVSVADGSATLDQDYQAPSVGQLTFDETRLSDTVVVPILDDRLIEPGETFTVNLSQASIFLPQGDVSFPLASPPDATVTILDDDGPGTVALSAVTYQVGEGDASGGIAIAVTRTGGRAGAASVDFAVTAGTATASADFTPVSGQLAWADGDGSTQTFVVPVVNDGLVDPNETVSIALSNPVGATLGSSTATLTIVDDDSPPNGGGNENISAPVGGTATATFAITGTGPFTLSAQTGTVTPATLPASGNATYTLTIDPATQSGSTINDVISITDGGGNVVTKQVAIQVTPAVARAIADIPTLTPNQAEVAIFFDDLCPRLGAQGAQNADQAQLLDVCAGLRDPATTDSQVIQALDQLSAQELITAATTTLRLAGVQHGNLTDRINSLRSGATGLDVSGLNVDVGGQSIGGPVLAEVVNNTIGKVVNGLLGGAAGADEFDRWGLFVNGKVSYGDKDETTREAGFSFDTVGLTAGVDYRFDSNFVLGLALGYAAADSSFDSHRGGLDIETWSGSVFGTYFVADKFYLDGMLTYGTNGYDSVRHITFTDTSGLTAETATGNTDGMQLSGGFASGFDFNRGKWTFGPHLGMYYIGVDTDGFTESGAGGLNLMIGDEDATSFTVNAGGHLSMAYTARWGVLVPQLRIDLVHEFEDSRETVNLRFAADPFRSDPSNPTPTIVLETDSPDADYVMWSAGVSAQFINGISGFVSYRSMAGFDDFSLGELTYGLRMEKSL